MDDLSALMPKGSEADRIFNGTAIGGSDSIGTNNTSIILTQLASLKAETTFGFRRMDEKFTDAKDAARSSEERLVERVRAVESSVVPRPEIMELSERSKLDRDDLRRLTADHASRIKLLETATTASEAIKKVAWLGLAVLGTICTTILAPALLHLMHLS